MKRLRVLLVIVAATVLPASGQDLSPDRDPEAREWGYRPAEGSEVSLNPPSLTWVHEPGAAAYAVQIAPDTQFTAPVVSVEGHPWPVYTHDTPLPEGTWFWRYRIEGKGGRLSSWSRARRFQVGEGAVAFPMPSPEALRQRIPEGHPRLFVRPEGVEALRRYARGAGRSLAGRIRAAADSVIRRGPTPEPTVMASLTVAENREFWWPNAMQTTRAVKEAELIAFAYLLTGEAAYGEAARRWILHVASWDPAGPSNWTLNDEAGMPILQYLPVAYTWAYDALTPSDRETVREVMQRRGMEAWRGYQHKEGVGRLNQPYDSHGNRSWFMLGGAAIVFIDTIPEAATWLDFAVNKFYAAYPVWSDADGGWHEGPTYQAGYTSGVTFWLEMAEATLGIRGIRKPFFSHAGDAFLYTAPPGTPNMGFGDLSFGPARTSWSFIRYYARKVGNPYWAWWADASGIRNEPDDLVQAFFWSRLPHIEPKAPLGVAQSKVFYGTGLAFLNSSLLDAGENVQVRFKSSPFGRQSHGHDPHNSFTVNAYGEALLVNNVYRDFWTSPFHTGWVWNTRAQNALLVNGKGQRPASSEPHGRIVAADLQEGADYVAGEAAAAYEGALHTFVRHIVFVKPDVIVLADEVKADTASRFQWMLHAETPFEVLPEGNTVRVQRDSAGVLIHFVAAGALNLTQTTGYDPAPDAEYMKRRGLEPFPEQWHLEASTPEAKRGVFALTVVRPYRDREAPAGDLVWKETDSALQLELTAPDGAPIRIALRKPGASAARIDGWSFDGFARAQRGDRSWVLGDGP